LMVFDWHSCRINKENSFCRVKAMFFCVWMVTVPSHILTVQ
jgi:hypothetical protein